MNPRSDPTPSYRATCYRCFRPEAMCYCDSLERVDNRTHVIVVQHPRERFHPIGTVRMIAGSLENVRVVTGYPASLREGKQRLELPPDAGLLYPAPDARDLADVPRDELPGSLVVLDGTWHQAQSLYRNVPALRHLPKFKFAPEVPSRYRIRAEPRAEYVSTLEAVVHSLGLMEPETRGLDALLSAFEGMIDRQIAAMQQ
jgi:DTW domain-containing protein YfiP